MEKPGNRGTNGPRSIERKHETASYHVRLQRETTTHSWRPSCKHAFEVKDALPCVVLDPFCGSGTTGLVAKKLGRSFLGIDLHPDYCAMARERIKA